MKILYESKNKSKDGETCTLNVCTPTFCLN